MSTYGVQTDHQILAFGEHLMQLFDTNTGQVVVTANRDSDTGIWTVQAAGVAEKTAPTVNESETPRSEVIQAMVDLALESLGGTGYSTLVPHGLPATP